MESSRGTALGKMTPKITNIAIANPLHSFKSTSHILLKIQYIRRYRINGARSAIYRLIAHHQLMI